MKAATDAYRLRNPSARRCRPRPQKPSRLKRVSPGRSVRQPPSASAQITAASRSRTRSFFRPASQTNGASTIGPKQSSGSSMFHPPFLKIRIPGNSLRNQGPDKRDQRFGPEAQDDYQRGNQGHGKLHPQVRIMAFRTPGEVFPGQGAEIERTEHRLR